MFPSSLLTRAIEASTLLPLTTDAISVRHTECRSSNDTSVHTSTLSTLSGTALLRIIYRLPSVCPTRDPVVAENLKNNEMLLLNYFPFSFARSSTPAEFQEWRTSCVGCEKWPCYSKLRGRKAATGSGRSTFAEL